MEQELPPPRVYVDTSVFGGVFDPEFARDSTRFFAAVRKGRIALVVSDSVMQELIGAPADVREFARTVLESAEVLVAGDDTLALADAYLSAGIVTAKYRVDALHIALATVARCGLIASWNFAHIVNERAISRYNGVNERLGYAPVAIHAPWEEVWYEKEL